MKKELSRNKPYCAFDIRDAKTNGDEFVINRDKIITLFDGRYCAVAGFFFSIYKGKFCVLANLRGIGAPDKVGKWNCPCGFLERNENALNGVIRETKEECGFIINPDKVKVKEVFTQTDPFECNNGNVTIHHVGFCGCTDEDDFIKPFGGEENEVETIKWIPINEIYKYDWAFGHEYKIMEYVYRYMKRYMFFSRIIWLYNRLKSWI